MIIQFLLVYVMHNLKKGWYNGKINHARMYNIEYDY